MKRASNIYETIISDSNLRKAITEVNRTHHWKTGHKPNKCTAWVELTINDRVKDLRQIIEDGFKQKPPRIMVRYDASARKTRTISEPAQWPDQYIHHALIQALQPVMMRGMDPYCCGSIRGRGAHYAKRAIERWVSDDRKGTRWALSADIRHFYDSLQPKVVMERMRHLVKDHRALDLIWRVIKGGVKIGAYPSQWFANTTLQPLDAAIRQSGYCNYYVRYMDNFTVLGSNKRKLRKLRRAIAAWLSDNQMELKSDWQVYPLHKRLPDAVGYRYGRGYTLPRKHNLLRLKRALGRYRKRRDHGRVSLRLARSILSRLGQIRHCNNYSLYKVLYHGERVERELKQVIRSKSKEGITWIMYLAQLAATRLSEQRALTMPA